MTQPPAGLRILSAEQFDAGLYGTMFPAQLGAEAGFMTGAMLAIGTQEAIIGPPMRRAPGAR